MIAQLETTSENAKTQEEVLLSQVYQVLPPLTAEERASLKESIKRDGVLVPVEEDEHGNVLDGYHRVELWTELRAEGVRLPDYPIIIRPRLSEAEKRAHARALNLSRRHLNQEQRRKLIEDQLREAPERSDRQIAEALHVDNKTVAKRRKHLESTEEIPQLEATQGKDGKNRPARKPAIIAKDSREAKRSREAIALAGAEALPSKILDARRTERICREARVSRPVSMPAVQQIGEASLRVGDLIEALADIPDHSVPLILCDPPYVPSMMDVRPKLAQLAARILREDGVLLAYAGQWHLPRCIQDLSAELDYCWMMVVLHSGPCGWSNSRHFQVGWKPVLVFTRRGFNRRPRWAEDVVRGAGAEKGLHLWQQGEGEFAELIRRFTDPGELVVDPFLGSGTTAAAAVKLGRRFIGCDVNPGAVAIAQERLLAIQSAEKETA
jgi:DNA modification methylase